MRRVAPLPGIAALLLASASSACVDSPEPFNAVDREPDSPVSPWRLTFNPGDDRTPSWSRDGDTIYYSAVGFEPGITARGMLLAQPMTRGAAYPLLETLQRPSSPQRWLATPTAAPTGARVAFVEVMEVIEAEPCFGTWVCDAPDTTGSVAMLHDADVRVRQRDATGPLSADPLLRLALPARSEPSLDPETGLVLTTLEVFPFQHLFRDDGSQIFRPSWAPDGQRIVASDGVGLRIWNPDTGEETAIPGTEDGVLAAWSPDGEWIAFVKPERADTVRFRCTCLTGFGPVAVQDRVVYRAGRRRIALIRPDGTGYTELADGTEPAWLPDGQGLCYRHAGRLWSVSLAGGAPEAIANTVDGREPAVSPDGRYIAFARRGDAQDFDVWVTELWTFEP